jgi:hypothetical protein
MNYDWRTGELRLGLKTERKHRKRCGARCRTKGGDPCQAPAVWDKARDRPRNGRCKLHGGLSTGAKTVEGWAKLREAGVTTG